MKETHTQMEWKWFLQTNEEVYVQLRKWCIEQWGPLQPRGVQSWWPESWLDEQKDSHGTNSRASTSCCLMFMLCSYTTTSAFANIGGDKTKQGDDGVWKRLHGSVNSPVTLALPSNGIWAYSYCYEQFWLWASITS